MDRTDRGESRFPAPFWRDEQIIPSFLELQCIYFFRQKNFFHVKLKDMYVKQREKTYRIETTSRPTWGCKMQSWIRNGDLRCAQSRTPVAHSWRGPRGGPEGANNLTVGCRQGPFSTVWGRGPCSFDGRSRFLWGVWQLHSFFSSVIFFLFTNYKYYIIILPRTLFLSK